MSCISCASLNRWQCISFTFKWYCHEQPPWSGLIYKLNRIHFFNEMIIADVISSEMSLHEPARGALPVYRCTDLGGMLIPQRCQCLHVTRGTLCVQLDQLSPTCGWSGGQKQTDLPPRQPPPQTTRIARVENNEYNTSSQHGLDIRFG